jgi:hypothetical protein
MPLPQPITLVSEHLACRWPTEVDHTYTPGHWPIKANLNTQSCQSVKNSPTTPCNHACLPPSYEMYHVPTAQGPDSLLFTHIQLEQTHPPINFLISASFFTLSPFMRRTAYSINRENARPHAQVRARSHPGQYPIPSSRKQARRRAMKSLSGKCEPSESSIYISIHVLTWFRGQRKPQG